MLWHASQIPYSSFGPGWIGLSSLQFVQNADTGRLDHMYQGYDFSTAAFVAKGQLRFDMGGVGLLCGRPHPFL